MWRWLGRLVGYGLIAMIRVIRASRRYQLVRWFPDWHGFAFVRLDPRRTDLALIYDWCLYVGFWELRRWHGRCAGWAMRRPTGCER